VKIYFKPLVVTGVRIFFILAALPVLYALEPFIKLRFCLMPNQRIGHLAVNTDTLLRRLTSEGWPPRTFYIFLIWDPANQQMVDMFKRKLTILQNKTLVQIYYAVLPIINRTRFSVMIIGDSHPYTFVANTMDPVLSFTPEEEDAGKRGLAEMEIGADDWFVCFHGRDTRYLEEWRPQFIHLWNKTVYRNSNEADYLPAVESIVSSGGHALRMGAVVTGPLAGEHEPRIIDYSTRFRTDFMDIYLAAKCRYFIGTNSGYDFIPTVFGVPVIMVNMVPPCRVPCGPTDLFIPKLLVKEDEGRYLTFDETKELGFFKIGLNQEIPDICEQHGLIIIDNSPEEILAAAHDMQARIAGHQVESETEWLQQQYYDNYLSDIQGFEVVGAKIAPSFALKYKDLIASPAKLQSTASS